MIFGRKNLITVSVVAALSSCASDVPPADGLSSGSGQTALQWMELIYSRVQADQLSPPSASRVYAYAGVALYEAAAAGRPDRLSLSGQLRDLPLMEPPPEALDRPCAAAGALSALAEDLLPRAESQSGIRGLLRQQLDARAADGAPPDLIEASKAYGQRLGRAIAAWAATDGFVETRGLPYARLVGPGLWEPTGANKAPALEPYWGTLRPFVLPSADACAPPAPVAYSESAGSEFYKQADAVFQTSRTLDEKQKAIARFWADGPGATGTPSGHWVAIYGQEVRARQLSLLDAAEGFGRLGLTVGDSFISCWQGKYRYNLLRPETYIQQYIDPAWQPLLSTPPFPEYTSGHSVVSMASAMVLTDLLGAMPLVDRTHEQHNLAARAFASFEEAAREAADSRLYGGIHFPMAIERGLDQGRCVGRAILTGIRTRR